jgi:multisubunit Na+/H+ antiporter MnhF subunit
MNLVTSVCLAILALSRTLCVVRLARSGSLGDRIVALDMLLM